MNPLKAAFSTLGVVVAVFLLWKSYSSYTEYAALKDAAQKQKIAVATDVVAHADTVYDTARVGYIEYRDRILRSGTATPRDSATFKKANAVVVACDSLKSSSRALETVLRDPPTGVRRVQAFGEAMYDVAHQVPVIRAGATAKVIGPISLSVAGEYAAPPAGQSNPAFRALAGVRINF